jgi:hypothetical protein
VADDAGEAAARPTAGPASGGPSRTGAAIEPTFPVTKSGPLVTELSTDATAWLDGLDRELSEIESDLEAMRADESRPNR